MAAANPLWGAPRIHGELGKLGVDVSERTVSRLLRRPRRPPSQTWRTFLTNHVATLASIDFLTVPTLTGRVLFVFIVLMHHRRQIVHVNVTEHPTAAWTAQQLINAFPDDRAPLWLLRDRDANAFRRRIAGMGIGEVVSSARQPLAESLRGEANRIAPTGMSGPRDRLQRAALAARLDDLSQLLPRLPHASLAEERRAHSATASSHWRRRRGRILGSRRTAPSLRTTRSLTGAVDRRLPCARRQLHEQKSLARPTLRRVGSRRFRCRVCERLVVRRILVATSCPEGCRRSWTSWTVRILARDRLARSVIQESRSSSSCPRSERCARWSR